MNEYAEHQCIKSANRRGFEQNYIADVTFFEAANTKLRSIWERIGTIRVKTGHSHVGLLLFANILPSGFGICDKNATKPRKGGISK